MQNPKQNTYSFYHTQKTMHICKNIRANAPVNRIHSKYYYFKWVKKNSIFLFLLFAMITSILLFGALFSSNSSQYQSAPNKYFKSIQIQKGDTLWSIAKENMDPKYYKNVSEYVKEIKMLNALVSDRVTAGNYIIIPYYMTD